ncbi:WD40 repeat-like protein [Neoconidiobolus thromboides FSU 785]|nr:WD40 repeat-like protein [Neoconidiobolus thromboides FSU 785]
MFMDTYSPIDEKSAINNLNDGSFIPLEYNIQDQGPILGLQLSKDNKLLATMSSLGHIKLWEIGSFKLLATLRDNEETEIDEFYKGQFSPTQQYFVTGGKRKDRTIWSEQDNDNKIIDCYIKVFDLLTGKVINLLKAHTEEILSIKQVYFKSQNYYLSTSQDGYIYKWLLSKDHKEIISSTRIQDNDTCMAFNVSFLPNTGNKYFLGACDNMIKLFDFEHAKPVQKFESPYSSYCDNIKFLNLFPDVKEQLDNLYEDQIEDNDNERNHAYFISRGVELLDDDGNMLTDTENTVNLHILCYPKFSGDTFKIKNLKCFKDERYASNSWYINITSNGRYIMAPTVNGEVFIFCLITGNVKGVLKDHGDIEIRDLIFHPNEKYFFTCSEGKFYN